MITDLQLELSKEQALVASADSTNIIDTGGAGAAEGMTILITVDESFATATSYSAEVTSSATVGGTYLSHGLQTGAVAVADLTAGDTMLHGKLPRGTKQFVKVEYVEVGSTASAGKVTARIISEFADATLTAAGE